MIKLVDMSALVDGDVVAYPANHAGDDELVIACYRASKTARDVAAMQKFGQTRIFHFYHGKLKAHVLTEDDRKLCSDRLVTFARNLSKGSRCFYHLNTFTFIYDLNYKFQFDFGLHPPDVLSICQVALEIAPR